MTAKTEYMSVAPRNVTPTHRINDYTVVISEGAEQGVSEGDSFLVTLEDRMVNAVAISVGKQETILELTRTDIKSYV